LIIHRLILKIMFKEFILEKIVVESTIIKSFYFRRLDNKTLDNYSPGQYAIIRIKVKGSEEEIIRNYTISDTPGTEYYRLTIKRESHGRASRYFHDVLHVGDTIEISKPSGDFYLTKNSLKPVVLISGGVGITPMLSMLEYITINELTRKIFFLHANLNKSVQAMFSRLRELNRRNKNLYLSIHHSEPDNDEQINIDYDYEGFITKKHLESALPKIEMDYFLCGPVVFMEIMFQYLKELGVNEKNIKYEFFGEGKKLGNKPVFVNTNTKNHRVKFTKSNKETNWDDNQLSILDLAESAGLTPEFSCRMGTCSTCETTLHKGDIEYDPEPFMEIPEGRVLICCSKPKSNIEIEL
jgi:ferredoxin-NADP reductase